jgi:hypothetical protein
MNAWNYYTAMWVANRVYKIAIQAFAGMFIIYLAAYDEGCF